MSTDVAALDVAPPASLDKNARAAEDAKKMLAELSGATTADTNAADESTEKTNDDTQNAKPVAQEKSQDESPKDRSEEGESERTKDRRHRDDGRSFRGGRGRGGYQARNYRDNIKSDLTTQEESSDPVAIRKQVEFYFSDSNLPMDKFLLSKVGGSENRPVELKIIHSFKRMRHFQPFEAIVSAMKDSLILQLTDDDTCVQRIEPLPESLNQGPVEEVVKVFEDRAMPRSIYAKGFGDEIPSTQFDIEAFFAPYGPTNAIRLRRTDTKSFKGSVFVEFASEELQQSFLGLDPKPKYHGKELQVMSKKAYCDGKVEDIKSGKIKANDRNYKTRDGPYGSREKRKRDDEDDRDWRERREDDRRNGFRDDRRGGRNRRGSPDYQRGGKGQGHRGERDRRGVPVVGTSDAKSDKLPEAQAKREAATADALAKAKAMVEAEQKKSANSETEAETNEPASKDDAVLDQEAKPAEPETESVAAKYNGDKAGEVQNKKRAREEDGEAPEAKKLDTKDGPVDTNGHR